MPLVRVTCELRYENPMSLLKGHEEISRRFLGQEPDVKLWLVPGLRLENKQLKEILVLDQQRTITEVHEPASVAHAIEMVRQRVDLVETAFGIPDVSRWGCRTVWVTPFEGTLMELKELFKKNLFGEIKLAEQAADLAVILDFEPTRDHKVRVQWGPMWPEQLRQAYLTLGTADSPEAFILTDVDLGTAEPKTYSKQALGRLLSFGIGYGQSYAELVAQGVLGR